VAFVLANSGFINAAHSIDPGLEGFLLLCLTVFDMILQIIIQVCVELVTKGGVIKQGGGIPQKTIQLDDVLGPHPEGLFGWIKM